jgi:hypothetical protein
MKAAHKITEGKTNRQIANMAMRAMSNLQDYSNGTIKNPNDLASSIMPDGRTLIQTIYEDGFVRYNDGWHIVEVDDYCLYVDFTGLAVREMGFPKYEIEDEINEYKYQR